MTTATLPPMPAQAVREASEWLGHLRAYQAMNRAQQNAWYATLDATQQTEFKAAWVKLGFDVPDKSRVTCPRCGANVRRGEFGIAVSLVCIFLFPFGLLALLYGRDPSKCLNCGNRWKA